VLWKDRVILLIRHGDRHRGIEPIRMEWPELLMTEVTKVLFGGFFHEDLSLSFA
jgi:hypothetical protein